MICDICGKTANDWHHAILHGRKAQKWRNAQINLQPLCRACHIRYGNDREARITFIEQQIEQHGIQAIWDWMELAPERYRKPGTDYSEVVRILKGIEDEQERRDI